MKKFYTLLAVAVMAAGVMTVSAQSLSTTSGLWGKAITSSATGNAGATQGSDVALAKDGSGLYLLGSASTSASTDNVSFGSDVIASGIESTTSASGNNGLWLIKTDEDGNMLWTLTSKYGDFTANSQYIAATGDGGVVLYLLARHTINSVDFNNEHLVTLVDADGSETEIADWNIENETNRYGALLVKVSKAGKIEWTNLIDASTEPIPDKPTAQVSQGIYPAGLAITDAGDIFVAGRNVRDLYIEDVTIPNHNVATTVANGGGLYVIKLDKNGNYVKHIVSGGESTKEAVLELTAHGNNIYLMSLITGKEGTEITLGDKSVIPANTNNTLSVAKLDGDLNVAYFRYYTNSLSGSALQMPFISVQNGTLWMAGKAKLALDELNVSTGSLTRASIVIKADPATGDLIAAKSGTTNQGGNFSVLVNDNDEPYIFGHVLNQPLTMSKLDPTTLETVDEVQLYSQSSDTQGVAADGNKIFVMWRLAKQAGRSNDGVITNEAPRSFSSMVGAFKLPEKVSTAITTVKQTDDTAMRVYGANGVAHIVADKAQTVVIYNLAGARVAVADVQPGDNTVSLAAGLYVAAGQKIVVR